MPSPNNIVAIASHQVLDSQALLAKATVEWQAAGIRVVGLVAENNNVAGECSTGYVHDIASGKSYSIHPDRPPAGKTCHLDASGVEDAGYGLLAQMPAADGVFISKFGKPVLTTVSGKHLEACKAFAPGSLRLDGDKAAIDGWWRATRH